MVVSMSNIFERCIKVILLMALAHLTPHWLWSKYERNMVPLKVVDNFVEKPHELNDISVWCEPQVRIINP